VRDPSSGLSKCRSHTISTVLSIRMRPEFIVSVHQTVTLLGRPTERNGTCTPELLYNRLPGRPRFPYRSLLLCKQLWQRRWDHQQRLQQPLRWSPPKLREPKTLLYRPRHHTKELQQPKWPLQSFSYKITISLHHQQE
jgi:hypothetical protein